MTSEPTTSKPPTLPQSFPGQRLLDFRRDPLATLRRAATYGDVVRLPLSPAPVFLVNHPDLIKDIFVTHTRQFKKSRGLEKAKLLLGDGLLTSEGTAHLVRRRQIQPVFHRQRIEAYARTMTDCAEHASARWKDGETRDMAPEMMRLTLDIVGQTLFGADMEAEAEDIGGAMGEALTLLQLLVLPYTDFVERLPLPIVRRFRRSRARLDETVYRLIAEHRQAGDRGDLLSLLLDAPDEEDGTHMSDTQVRDEVMTLFLAGHETTANALAWTWYLLSQHPDAETRLHTEIDAVLEDRSPTLDDLPKLIYTRKILSESLRLYPPAWAVGRRALTDCDVGGFRLPAGSIVLLSQAVTHRDPRFWLNADQFDPDRWTLEAEATRPKFAFFPFGGGPRVCIGEHFTWMELILALAALARRWRMRLAPGQVVATQPIITLRPRFGMRMVLEQRTQGTKLEVTASQT